MSLILVDCEAPFDVGSPAVGDMTEFGAVEFKTRETFHGRDCSRHGWARRRPLGARREVEGDGEGGGLGHRGGMGMGMGGRRQSAIALAIAVALVTACGGPDSASTPVERYGVSWLPKLDLPTLPSRLRNAR